MRIFTLFLASCLLGAASFSAPAWAGDPVAQAKQDFAEGQRAFRAGDYRHAAESFESAYKASPHPASLWNAARAWHRADERARAANLYSKYLKTAPPDAKDRNSALEDMKQLSSQLVRFEIHAVDLTDVRIDGQPVEDLVVFVTPGAHVITAKQGDKVARKEQNGAAGSVVSVVLEVAPEKPAPAPAPAPAPGPDALQQSSQSSGLSPVFVIVGAALTAGGVGVTVWSGLDTVNAKNSYDAHPSATGLADGNAKQTRTNVFLGATIGMAALTGATAIFFTNWGRKSGGPEVGIGPTQLSIRQDF